jgi:hypothetical protein
MGNDKPGDFRGFLNELGLSLADFHYISADISDHPYLRHHEDTGEAYGMGIAVDKVPDYLKVGPTEIEFNPLPYVEDFWYRLDTEEGTVEMISDQDGLLDGTEEIKIIPECAGLVSATVEDINAAHERVIAAAEKFGFTVLP